MISRVVLTSLAVSALLSLPGCKESNPYYLGKDASVSDAPVSRPETAKPDGAPSDTPVRDATERLDTSGLQDAPLDQANDRATTPDLPTDRGGNGRDADGVDLGGDVRGPETGPRDGRPDLGGGPDARDGGVLPDAPGVDPDTAPSPDASACVEGTTQACPNVAYPLVGVCQAGTQTCLGGHWNACTGALAPLGVEACNNQDDTCSGAVDDGLPAATCGLGACVTSYAPCAAGASQACVPGAPLASTDDTCDGIDDNCDGRVDEGCPTCVHVAPTGDDDTADGTATLPFATIQAAIAFANGAAERPKQVCVAGAATCAEDSATYLGPLVIPQGITVTGGYASSDWSVCPDTTPGTSLKTNTAAGVTFSGADANLRTGLARFAITRESATSSEALAAVTVDGVPGVVLSNLAITDEPSAPKTYGVNILGGASVTIARSTLYAGGGTTESMAVRVGKGTLDLRENCDALDARGGCASPCGTAIRGLFGRQDTTLAEGSQTSGLWLGEASKSLIQANTLCGGQADQAAAVRIAGTASGVVIRGNLIENTGGAKGTQAIQLGDCGDASPLISANTLIGATAAEETAEVEAIRAKGKCHPVIENNLRIEVNGLGGGTVHAIHCLSGSRCAVLGNGDIAGTAPTQEARVVGIRCDGEGACARVADNTVTLASGKQLVGVWLEANNTVVMTNAITGGCAKETSIGVLLQAGSRAKVANNQITASTCVAADPATTAYYGVRILHDGSTNEPVVSGNTINPVGGAGVDCASQAIDLSSSLAGAAPAGVFTGNTLFPGACDTAFGFVESGALHARVVTENNFVPGSGTAPTLYRRGGASVGDIAAVNALAEGTTAGGNTSTTP